MKFLEIMRKGMIFILKNKLDYFLGDLLLYDLNDFEPLDLLKKLAF